MHPLLVAVITLVLLSPVSEYVFPSTIYAHSAASVGFHANEME